MISPVVVVGPGLGRSALANSGRERFASTNLNHQENHMGTTSKIVRLLRTNLLAGVALFVALGGSAYAADTIFSTDIVDGEVQSVDVRDDDLTGTDISGLTGSDITNGTVASLDVQNASLTGDDVQNDSLKSADVSDLGSADISGLTGSDLDADSVKGADIDESTLTPSLIGCKDGLVNGYARINGTNNVPGSYVDEDAWIDRTYNCAGDDVVVRRESEGVYFVKFEGNSANLALAVPNQDGASTDFSGDADNKVTVGKITSGPDAGSFRLDVLDDDVNGSVRQDGDFTIMLL